MIVTFDDLKNYRGAVAMVDGAFDPLHRGHIEYFRAASALLVPLLCNIASDRYVRSKHVPLLPEDQRAAVVDAIRYISYTPINQFDTETILGELGLPKSEIDRKVIAKMPRREESRLAAKMTTR